MRKITISILASCVLLFTGCSKDEEATTSNKTKTELLTSGKWYYKSITISPAFDVFNTGTPITDVFSHPQSACSKDNILTFFSNGQFEQEKDIVIEGSPANIVKLDATDFIIKRTDVQNGQSYTITISFKH
jgi:PBP1b-binding outer membrane lipoprotein LpoB